MKYKEIEYSGHLDGCIDELLKYKAKGELVSINFNDHMLYSDTITVDGAYQEVLGVTKVEWKERYERERLRHEKRRMEDNMEISKKAIRHYGTEKQIIQSIEEMAELIQAISKCIRYKDDIEVKQHITEEIADTLIMINQLEIIFDTKEERITKAINKKFPLLIIEDRNDYDGRLRTAMKETIEAMKNISEKQNVEEGIGSLLIVIERIKRVMNIKDYEIECYKQYKLERLEKRINNERGMKL